MSGWAWQNDAMWQSCSVAAHKQADQWLKDPRLSQQRTLDLIKSQPLLASEAEINEIHRQVGQLRQLSQQLVVIGTGGASLGAQTLCALAQDRRRVRFLENCDPASLEAFLQLPLQETCWCIISKSGETVETLAAALSLLAHYKNNTTELAKRVRVITSNPRSALAQLAEAQGWQTLTHPATLSGRFSAFSVVGLLPASYAGLDIAALVKEAREVFAAGADSALMQHGAWLAANAGEKPMQLLMAYADALRPATQFYKQLWAESLGKSGQGPTPLTAIGSIDQHSQLQLYLDGPRDKLITLWLPDMRDQGAELPDSGIKNIHYLARHRMGDVMFATAEATAKTLAKANVPLRVLRGKLEATSLASWMARQMVETVLVAVLLEVDPYSQPAVEEGKRLTRESLVRRA